MTAPTTTSNRPAPTTPPPAPGQQSWLTRLLRECLRFPRTVALILGISVTTIAFVVAGPLLTREGVNAAMAGETDRLWLLGGGLILIAAFDFLGDYLRRSAAGRLSLHVQHNLRSRVFEAVQRLDGQGQDSLRAGQVVSRTNSDLQQIQTLLQMCPVPLAVLTYYLLGTAVMLWLSPSLTIIAVAVIALLGLTAWRTRKRVFAVSARAQEDIGEVTERVRATVAGISVVKSFGQEAGELRFMQRACARLFGRRLATTRAQAVPGATMLALPLLGQVALLAFGGLQTMNGTIDFGTFVAFSLYLGMLTGPTRVLASFLVIAQRTRASVDRVTELIDTRPEIHDGTDTPPATGGLHFTDVSFGYTSDNPVLRDVTFSVAPGETVAVTGASGSGKSTLALLAPRFYDPLTGGITLGDPGAGQSPVDLRDLRLEELRREIGVVFEEPFLFNATVRENIAYGHAEVAEAEVVRAAVAAGADEFIRQLDDGYDTVVAEGGHNLSGGQRQRIALARALLSAPRVLIVDDATSAVDAATEAEINTSLRAYAADPTADRMTVLIARRRSTLALADRIIVLDEGRTVGMGTWPELMETCPQFRALVDAPGEELGDRAADSAELDAAVENPVNNAVTAEAAPEGPVGTANRLPAKARAAATDRSVDRVARLLSPVAGLFFAALGLIGLSALANVLVPVLIQQGIDRGVLLGDGTAILVFALLALLLVAGDWGLYTAQQLTSARASESVQYGVRVRSFQHVLGMPLPYFERERGGQILTRLTVDVDSLARFLQTGLANGAMSLATIAGVGIGMIVFSPALAAVALSPVPFVFIATLIFRRLSTRAYDRAREDIGRVNSSLQENLSGLRVVQAQGQQSSAAAVFRRFSERYRLSREVAQKCIALYFPFIVFCSQVSSALVLAYGARLVSHGELSPGVFAGFILLQAQFFGPLQQLATIIDSFQQALVGVRRTDELLSWPSDDATGPAAAGAAPNRLSGGAEVALRGLTYRHEGAARPALNRIDLDIPAGSSLAVVGATGAGKTTLVKVLAGLYPPTAGQLLVDGAEVSEGDRRQHRRRVGVVAQEPHLFSGTIADNIRYGCPTATDSEVERAAAEAGALTLIARLPGGFAHEITEGGANLAAGQRQLITLARACLVGADMLLLDETTAHLDTRSENTVMDALTAGDRTVVVVAHRLSTAARCQRIAVLGDGEVIEMGRHEELLARPGGAYARLWEHSGRTPREEPG